jgi:hypothetical protein
MSSGATLLSSLGKTQQAAPTVPENGLINPSASCAEPVGTLIKGDTLISNFNNKANMKGTGTTIVQVWPTSTKGTIATIGTLTASPQGCW